jgi:citrate lyase beta subunit
MMHAAELGATLYVPVQRPNLLSVVRAPKGELRSIVICLEDSLRPDDIEPGKTIFCRLLRDLAGTPPRLLVYARPRDPEMLGWMLAQPGAEALSGFVLPKITAANLSLWLVHLDGGTQGIMPTIESTEAFDRKPLKAIRRTLQPLFERVHAVRIGGNDILNQLGVRRSRQRTAYDGPLGQAIATMASEFIPHGMAVSAPVFEHYRSLDLLREEVTRDLEHGLLTKTAIHPDQVPIIHAAMRPALEELDEARAILDRDARAVFGRGGSMCEPTTHSRWAETVLQRARIYGTQGDPERGPGLDTRVA